MKTVRKAKKAARPKSVPLYKTPAAPIAHRVEDLLSRMTLRDKIYQICGAAVVGWITEPAEVAIFKDNKFDMEKGKKLVEKCIGGVSELLRYMDPAEGARTVNELQKHAMEKSRLGIPVLVMDEALHGSCAKKSTAFPQAIGLGSTWDPDLMKRIGQCIGREARSRGITQVLAPDLDISRDPRWGRTEETYGEDPYLISRLGVGYIKGIQGDKLSDPDSVGVTLKHFAVHAAPEGGLNIGPTIAGQRMIRDQLLRPFEAAIKEAKAMSVMSAYSEIDGIPASGSRHLLTDVLRKEWGFEGFVVSDYGSVKMMFERHHTAADKKEAAEQAVRAGVDMELPSIDCYRELLAAVKEGKFSEETINESVRRILRAKFELGLFENPYVDEEAAEKASDTKAHRQLAYEAATKSIVLLKNEGVLPLSIRNPQSAIRNLRSIAVIGPNADAVRIGNYGTSGTKVVTALQGIRDRAPKGVSVRYAKGCEIYGSKKEMIPDAVALAAEADVAIVVVGEVSDWGAKDPNPICGESYDQDNLNLAGVQKKLVQEICRAQKNTIVVIYNGRPLSIAWTAANAPAIIEAWYPGEEGGHALADIIFGKVNPSGRLPITIPATAGQLPVYYNHKPTARGFNNKPGTPEVPGGDYVFSSPKPLWRFGHGLSYTTFKYENLQIDPAIIGPAGKVTVSVDLTNTGAMAGEEVVQLYVRDVVSSATRPVMELKGFQRIALKPGQKKSVKFTLGEAELAFWNAEMKFVVEPGQFEVMVGGNSVDLVKATFEVK